MSDFIHITIYCISVDCLLDRDCLHIKLVYIVLTLVFKQLLNACLKTALLDESVVLNGVSQDSLLSCCITNIVWYRWIIIVH